MIVVDTNVVAYAYIEGSKTALAQKVHGKDPVWGLPEIWLHEFLNVLASYVLQGGLAAEEAFRIWRSASSSLAIHTRRIDMADALRLAVSTPVSGYDAQFVSLAHALGVPLVTEDKELLKNFPSTSISMREFVSAG